MDASARVVLHLDMDAFFASCEEIRRPETHGRPIVIGADPQDGFGRGVVVSASYAARRFGIRSAMPIRDAWRLAPQAHYLVPDHSHYMEVSRRIFAELRNDFAIEQASVDEAYVDAAGNGWGEAEAVAAQIHRRVEQASGGLTCSVGVAPNKLLAKIASDANKPNGTTLVRPGEVQAFLDPLPARKIPGIGPKTSARLAEHGIHTVKQLRETPIETLERSFGVHGHYMADAARGLDLSRVRVGGRHHKSISEEHTFMEDTRSRAMVLRSMRRMVASLEDEMGRRDYWYRSVALKVRFSDFTTHTKQWGLPRPSADTTIARRVLPRLLNGFLEDPRPVRLIGVRFADLASGQGQQTLSDYEPAPAAA